MVTRILCSVIVIGYLLLNVACNDSRLSGNVENLTKDGQKIIDSIMAETNKKYQPYRYADSLVNVDHSLPALNKMDSLIKLYPNDHFIYICKGDWYFKNGEYDNALNQYTQAAIVAQDESPIILDKKAQAFIKLNKLTDAINCYKKAAEINLDYYYNLAISYELNKKIDSSIKYYSLYYKSYPRA
jgi:tetratricopeptide (TPR) repeat protein